MHKIILFFVILCVCLPSFPYNIQQINSRDGLSNSAITCLYQDNERYLWIGTYDGLNKYNGRDIEVYKPDIENPNSLSSNVIRRIVGSSDDYLWIMTKWGLNKYSRKSNRVEEFYSEFEEDCSIACDSKENIYLLTQSGKLYCYDSIRQKFIEIIIPNLRPGSNRKKLLIDRNDKILIITGGVIRQYIIEKQEGLDLVAVDKGIFKHSQPVIGAFYDKETLIFIDRKGNLFMTKDNGKVFVKNIHPSIMENGEIIAIIFDGNDFIIGFRRGGLIRLNSQKAYEIQKYPINCGIFSLLKDDVQDILWIGTDGQGIYAFIKDEYTFRGINLEELPIRNRRPIRAIFCDQYGDLWLGTKGSGIIKIKSYENNLEYDQSNIEHITTQNGLSENSVYVFQQSSYNNIIWIGTGGPEVNYYSYEDKKIHTLKRNFSTPFVNVHSLWEASDSILWATSLNSLFKVTIMKKGNTLNAQTIKRYDFDIKNKQIFNQIYSMCPENDSILWLAMRGNGAIRFNTQSGDYKFVTFDKNGIAPMNDLLSVNVSHNKDIWFGSSYGINKISGSNDSIFDYHNYNENDGLPNNTIHGILENFDGKLWLSSNMGIILFDPLKETFRNFNHKTVLKVIEFSDNACYRDEHTDTYFFGGVDGLIWINQEFKEKNNFIPPIHFTKLRIFNQDYRLDAYIKHKKDSEYLLLRHDQNFFTVSFSSNDFINGTNRKFSYILDNFNEVWMNTNSNEAQFTNIPPGEYTLRVKYEEENINENEIAVLRIVISPPWYSSIFAKIIYVIASICILVLIYMYLKKKYDKKRAETAHQLKQKYKEEMYENKLRFFTNITHEFCTPLTLIHTPSERILNYEGSDLLIKKYAQVIKSNTEKLNILIQEIIDFRRMETGNKVIKVESCNINEICSGIFESFANLAEENNIDFSLNITPAIIWNSDRSCIAKIMNNLISNAFKYTPENGCIGITVRVDKEQLIVEVYNSGKGIERENIPYIFNRYSVLDNVKQNSIKGLSSRNGLGLSICKSMVELLQGTITVESEVGKYAEFIVKLPVLDFTQPDHSFTQQDQSVESFSSYCQIEQTAGKEAEENIPFHHHSAVRPTILLIDDNEEILWMLNDILSEEYSIITAKDGNEGIDKIKNLTPELVITDIMMPHLDGISLTKQIKCNPYTMHIPLIVLSAKSTVGDKIEAIESGADIYIAKPFDVKYLKTVIRNLIDKKKKLQEYYNSGISGYDFMNGKLLAKEDRELIQAAIEVIWENIGNPEFNPENLADSLQISTRSLYRKFKDLDILSPKDFIKEQRIVYAARLMQNPNLTIQEIMYSAGFTTRSHFYKEFTKHYNQSPGDYREKLRHRKADD